MIQGRLTPKGRIVQGRSIKYSSHYKARSPSIKQWKRRSRLSRFLPRARRRYTPGMIAYLHSCIHHNYHQVLASRRWTCMYCGTKGTQNDGQEFGMQDVWSPLGPTATCPRCETDFVIGSATGFRVHDPFLIALCVRTWFRGNGYLDEDREPGKIQFTLLYVD
jgi:hypothetical protein